MTTLNTGTPASNESILAQALRGLGLNSTGIAAFLGNFQVESGFSNTSYNAAENAHGFANWEGGRWTNLQAYGQAHGLAPTSTSAEIGFLQQELRGPYAGVLAQVKGAGTNLGQATQIVQSQYEGSTPASLGARQGAATSILGQLNSGKPLTLGTPSPGTAAGAQGSTSSAALFGSNIAPGGAWDPLNWPGDVLSSGASDIASGAESIIEQIAHPLFTFALNATLVIFGLVIIVIAFVLLAHSDDEVTTQGASEEAESTEQENAQSAKRQADSSSSAPGGVGGDAEAAAA